MNSLSRERVIYLFQEACLFLGLSYLVLMGGTFNGLVLPRLNLVNLVLIVLIGAAWFPYRIIRKLGENRTGLDTSIGLIIAAGIISTIYSIDPRRSIIGLVILVIAILVFYFFTDLIRSGLDPKLINKVLILVSCFILFFGIWELFNWYSAWLGIAGISQLVPEATYRVRAFLGHPNFLAAFLNLVIPVVLATMVGAKKRSTRFVLIVWLGVALALVFFTSSRGGWLGTFTAIGVFILGLLFSKWDWFKQIMNQLLRKRFLIFAIVLAVVLIVAGLFFLLRWQSSHPTHPSGWSNIMASRDYIWVVAWDMFKANPVTGNGLFTFGTEYIGVESIPPNLLLAHAHNFYFNVASEQGIIGVIALGVYIVSFFLILVKAWQRHDFLDRIEIAGLAGAIFGLGAHSLFETPQSLPLFLILPAVLIAQIAAGLEYQGKPRKFPVKNAVLIGLWVCSVALISFDSYVLQRYERGLTLASDENWADSADYLQEVTELDPGNSLYWFQNGYIYGKIALDEAGSVQDDDARNQAIQSYLNGLAIEPTYSVNWMNLGLLYKAGGEFEEAQKAMENAVSRSQKQPFFLITLGNLYEEIGQLENAEAAYSDALDLRPDWINIQYFQETSLRQYILDRWSLETDAEEHESANLKDMQAQIDNGSFQEALSMLQAMDKTNNPEAYELQGRAYIEMEEYKKAEKAFRTAIWMVPKDDLLLVRLYWGLGEAAAAIKDEEAAVSAFRSAHDLLERTTSYGVGNMGETQYSWYLFYKNSTKQDLLPGIVAPIYSEGMVSGLAYLSGWYCSNQWDELASDVIGKLDVVRADLLEKESVIIVDNCTH